MLATVEYEDGHKNFLNLLPTDDPDTFVNGELVKAGLAKVPRRLPRRANQELIDWLRNQQAEAFNNRVCIQITTTFHTHSIHTLLFFITTYIPCILPLEPRNYLGETTMLTMSRILHIHTQ